MCGKRDVRGIQREIERRSGKSATKATQRKEGSAGKSVFIFKHGFDFADRFPVSANESISVAGARTVRRIDFGSCLPLRCVYGCELRIECFCPHLCMPFEVLDYTGSNVLSDRDEKRVLRLGSISYLLFIFTLNTFNEGLLLP